MGTSDQVACNERPLAWLDTEPTDRPGENWRAIPEFEGAYEVSDQGRVRSLDREFTDNRGYRQRVAGCVLKQRLDRRGGYLRLNLYKNSKRYTRLVHRLILTAFMGPCPPGMEACHGDAVRHNNDLSNLRWDTKESNASDQKRHGTYRSYYREVNITLTVCNRGHALAHGNLVQGDLRRGKRGCLACQRARGRVHTRLRHDSAKSTDLQLVSDEAYSEILDEAGTSHEDLLAQAKDWVQTRLSELDLEHPEQATDAAEDHSRGGNPASHSQATGDTKERRGDTCHV